MVPYWLSQSDFQKIYSLIYVNVVRLDFYQIFEAKFELIIKICFQSVKSVFSMEDADSDQMLLQLTDNGSKKFKSENINFLISEKLRRNPNLISESGFRKSG